MAGRAAALVICAAALAVAAGCGTPSRAEKRAARLLVFREALPEDVRAAFDSIQARYECPRVGALLSEARETDPEVDAAIASIMHAELIDCFSDTEVVEFFWVYFADALAKGIVPDP